MDEVTSNIDTESAFDIYDQISKIHSDKIIFIISHDDMPKAIATKELILSKI